MNLPSAPDLRDRLARLDTDQILRLVAAMQQRIDALRAEAETPRAPVAIVGMACRFPGAPDLAAFRRLLEEGRDAVAPPPAGRPEGDGLPRGGYIDAIDRFDAAFFGIRDQEAACMDPQHRLALEVAWHALEDAGAAGRDRRPAATGIFLGISTHDYEARFHDPGLGFSPQATTGNAASAAAGRLAHLLDATGPALAIDTACSSSLVAIHAACRSLRLGECDLAIAGGVNLLVDDGLTRGFAAAGMLSPTHACRTFDAAADGYVRGEGAGFVVLRRLADATAAGDRVRAVVRGGAVNHDGRASSLTAPNGAAQVALIRAALADARLQPSEVQVVECHGTGTPLGDPIEVQALAEAYGAGREPPLLVGAVKTNIGHLEAAAGVAGLIKTVLALESGRLPPTLHQASPNPRIAWDRLPVRVVDAGRDWPGTGPRRAGVSSFGFGGTNAHLLLESVEPRPVPAAAGPLLLPISAPDEDGLGRFAAAVAGWLEGGDVDPAAACATLALGRAGFARRAAVVAPDKAGLAAGLSAVAAGEAPATGARGTAGATAPRIAFLFTGQGSQWSGMGRDLYDADPLFRDAIDRCARTVDPLIGCSLTALMFDAGEAERLADTRFAQPALFALGHALAERLAAWGIAPDIMAGHSLGEWIAACRAGVLALDDALRLVVDRGRLMASAAADGAMAVVFAEPQALWSVPAALRAEIDFAAFNAPDEFVVAGPAAAVAALCDALDAGGIGTQRLRTSHAFHSRLMDAALDPFADALAGVPLSPPRARLVSNLTGGTDAPFDTADYWVRHLRDPVRFVDGMETLAAAGAGVVIEIGASPALAATAGRAPAFAERPPLLAPTLRRNQPGRHTLAMLLAQLFAAGVPIAWDRVFDPAARAEAPAYPFADHRHWIAAPAAPASTPSIATVPADVPPADAPAPGDRHGAIQAALARALQLAPEDAASDRRFHELGIDSLALTEAVATLERRWRVAIPRRILFDALGSPGRLVAHVAAAAETAAAPRPAAAAASPAVAATVPAAEPPPALAAPAAELAGFARDYVARSRASREQRLRYGAHLADSRAVAGFRPETKGMLYPIVGARGAGGRLIDVDGNEYVDLAMGFGVQLFGHDPGFVAEAIGRHMAERGLFLGPQAPLAGEVAERLCRLTGTARAAFCNSGTEAVMSALRLARHATGRHRVALFRGSYHGHFDGTLAQPGAGDAAAPLAGGTPPGMVADLLLLDYDDEEGSLDILAREASSLAAVLVEPVQGRRPGHQPRAFLQRLRALTRTLGLALIFDEVLLGFRAALGGAQAWAGVRADLVTYGKIVGGGLPIGVVAGDARFLDALDGGAWPLDGAGGPRDERTFFAGTFNKNPLSMAASRAVLDHLEAAGPGLQEALNARTEAFAARLDAVLAEEGTGISIHRFSSLFRFVGASDLFYSHLVRNGVYVWEGRTCFLSTAHDDGDLERVEAAVRASARQMRAAGMLGRPRPAPLAGPAPAGPERLPTTAGQAALRLLAAFSPETSAAYNQSLVLDFSGPLDIDALEAGIRELTRRHEALRTTFPEDGASQLVHPRLEPRITVLDRSGDGDAALRRWLDEAVLAPFDLERGPLLAAYILRLATERYRLVLVMPHLVVDGWSMEVLAHELAELYAARSAGRPARLPEPTPYRRYAAHARDAAERPEAGAYWRALYATVPPALALPADRPRPPLQSHAGARATRRLPPDLAAALEARARRAGVSLFSLCLAAYGRLLAQLSGQEEAVVAIFSAGQPELAARSLVGYCISVLPLRIAAGPAISDGVLLASAQRAVADAMAHRDYPFARLLKELGLRRDPSRPPLAQASFNLDRGDAPPDFPGLATEMDANAHGAVRWDLNWNLRSDPEGLRIDAHYNRDLFAAARVEGWLDAYAGILAALAAGEAPPAAIPVEMPVVETLAARVARRAAAAPAAAAVRDREGVADYAGLEAQAAALAARLADIGIGPGDRVAFRLGRGLGPAVAMLAAGRLGAAFVPLDEEHPAAHHAFILEDSGAAALVVDAGTPAMPAATPVIEWSRHDPGDGRAMPPTAVAAEDIAYILYTSGSTGRPKGVRVPFGAVATYAAALLERLAVPQPASFAIVSSFAADLGYTSILGALWSGGTLHAVDPATARDPAALQRWMRESPVDVLKIVPAHLAALLDAPGARDLLPRRALVCGGDVLTWTLVDRVRALGVSCRVFNHYGPTETTIGACMTEALDRLRSVSHLAVPVGPPLAGYDVAILDAQGRPLPHGEEGEIAIAGAAVAAGYTRAEAPGAERFGLGPDGRRRYRTGDMGRQEADGTVTFVGRGDDMVKIRGHRIEPAGLAELLRSHPGVRDAAVLVERPEGRGPALLAAVAGDGSPAEIAEWLAERVPAAMVPARIVVRAALPLTTNGKVDRQALLAAAEPASPAASAEAGDERLARMCALWREVLRQPDLGPDDDFFALGGDSIVAIQIVGRARALGFGLTPTQVFQAPTPRGLVRLAVPAKAEAAGTTPVAGPLPLTPIQRWFLETPMPDRRRWCLSAVFAAPFAVTEETLRGAIEAIVARHDALRIRWDLGGDPPAQHVGEPPPPFVRVVEGTCDENGDAIRRAEDGLADRLMEEIDPAAGRMLAAGAIRIAGGEAARLVVAVHHGVFDMVSWSILADDLEAALTRGAAAIPPASTSWSWWAGALAGRAAAAASELPYWTAVAAAAGQAAMLPVDQAEGANREGDVRERRLRLPPARAEPFLEGMAAVFGLRPHEALLAAVGRALAAWAGGPLAVELEGHGRQPFDPAIDLSRTIGWFTARYPLLLPAADRDDPAGWVVAVKEAVRGTPGDGIGYGLLVHGAGAPVRVEAAVSFNFVGEMGQFGGRGLPLVRPGAGRERADECGRRHLLVFDGWQDGDGLHLSCRFAGRHAEATVEALLGRIDGEVTRLQSACAGFATAVYTPSDFTGIEFSQDELDLLREELGEAAAPVP